MPPARQTAGTPRSRTSGPRRFVARFMPPCSTTLPEASVPQTEPGRLPHFRGRRPPRSGRAWKNVDRCAIWPPSTTPFASRFNRDGLVVLPGHFAPELLRAWAREFEPLLEVGIERDVASPNRGPQRFYVTLPFRGVFADPAIYEDTDVLAIVERVAGPDPVMCQLAPTRRSSAREFQAWHADTPLLFPETNDNDTPSFQIAVNFPLVDVTDENGPLRRPTERTG